MGDNKPDDHISASRVYGLIRDSEQFAQDEADHLRECIYCLGLVVNSTDLATKLGFKVTLCIP